MGKRFSDAGENFYATTAQVIVSLFIAMALEFSLGRDAITGRKQEDVQNVVLISMSWIGLVACIRALAKEGTSVTVGFAGAGVTAASALVAFALYKQAIQQSGNKPDETNLKATLIVLLFLAACVVFLVYY